MVKDGEITLNCSTTAQYRTISIPFSFSFKPQPYTISYNNPEVNSNVIIRFDGSIMQQSLSIANKIYTQTFDEATNVSNFVVRVAEGISLTNFKLKPMLEEGSTASPYVPYNSIQIKKCNKNLYDDGEINYTAGDTYHGRLVVNVPSNRDKKWYNLVEISKIKLPITLSTYITVTTNNYNQSYVYFRFYNAQQQIVSGGVKNGNYATATNKRSVVTLTQNDIPETAKYLMLVVRIQDSGYTEKTQIEYGEVATNWVEHQEKTYNFPLSEGQKLMQDGKIEDKVVNEYREIILDGTENYNGNGIQEGAYSFVLTSYADIIDKSISSNLLCNILKPVSSGHGANICRIGTTGNIILDLQTDFCDYDTTALKQKLTQLYSNGTPVILQIPLATPDETEFTPEQQAVIDEIIKDGTYKELTHYTAEASLNPDIEAVGIKNPNANMTEIMNLINNLDARLTLVEE